MYVCVCVCVCVCEHVIKGLCVHFTFSPLRFLTRSWSPGAKDNIFNDLRYIWGGFAYLQDMMDSGVARAHGSTPPVGVYAQQMPYPCYVDDR